MLVEMMTSPEGTPGKEGMNLYVWDFGVNPKAPANANPWKPSRAEAGPKDRNQIEAANVCEVLRSAAAHPRM